MKRNSIVIRIFSFISIFNIYLNCWLSTTVANTIFVRSSSDMVVSIDGNAFTKYDLLNFFNIQKVIGATKYKELNGSNYNKFLDAFVDYQLRKKIIDYKEKIIDKDMEEFWDNNKFKFKTNLGLEVFCSSISVDKEFFVDYMNFLQKWQEYLVGDVVKDIRVSDDDVYEYLEIVNKDNIDFKQMEYSLYEIVLYFNNEDEKKQIINRMTKIKNEKPTEKKFKKMIKKYSQSNEQELERYMEKELNSTMLTKLNNLNRGEVSGVSCSEEEKGSCVIYYLVDKKISQPQLGEQEMVSLKNSLYIKQIEKKVHNLMIKQKNNSDIKYY